MEKDTEARILEAALEEFAEKGRDGARMQAIADRAGVNKALLHYYFRKKDDLYRSVLKSFFHKFFSNVQRIQVDPSSPEKVLKGIVEAYMGMLRANPKFPRLMMHQLLDRDTTQPIFQELFNQPEFIKVRSMLITGMSALQKQGVVRDVEFPAAVFAFIGSMVFFFLGMPVFQTVFPEADPTSDRFFEQYQQTVVTLFTHGLFTEGQRHEKA